MRQIGIDSSVHLLFIRIASWQTSAWENKPPWLKLIRRGVRRGVDEQKRQRPRDPFTDVYLTCASDLRCIHFPCPLQLPVTGNAIEFAESQYITKENLRKTLNIKSGSKFLCERRFVDDCLFIIFGVTYFASCDRLKPSFTIISFTENSEYFESVRDHRFTYICFR